MIFSKKQFIVFSTSILIFIILSYNFLDLGIAHYFLNHADRYRTLGKELSRAGESQWYFIIAILGALYFHFVKKNTLYLNRFLFLLYANIFSGLTSLILKSLFGRLRPRMLDQEGMHYGFSLFKDLSSHSFEQVQLHLTHLAHSFSNYTSFPSGHSTTTFTIFTYLALLFPKYSYLWLMIAVLVAGGRVIATAHYLSDVVAGATLGIMTTLYIYKKMKHKLQLKGNI